MRATLFLLSIIPLFSFIFAGDTAELKIDTVKSGDCERKAAKGDTLRMHYEGKLEDGTEFDSSYKRAQPFSFTLGQGMVIKGWEEGLEGMCQGEIRNLIIPPHMGYGDAGYPPVIPQKATLHFKVELLGWDDGNQEL